MNEMCSPRSRWFGWGVVVYAGSWLCVLSLFYKARTLPKSSKKNPLTAKSLWGLGVLNCWDLSFTQERNLVFYFFFFLFFSSFFLLFFFFFFLFFLLFSFFSSFFFLLPAICPDEAPNSVCLKRPKECPTAHDRCPEWVVVVRQEKEEETYQKVIKLCNQFLIPLHSNRMEIYTI